MFDTANFVVLPAEKWEMMEKTLSEVKELLDEAKNTKQSEWVESTEAREMLGVSPKTWQTYRNNGVIPFAQFGRKIYCKKADIEAFLQSKYIKNGR